jgi:hypothetical protein
MGQKTSPIGFRLGIVKPWRSRWFNHKNMPEWLAEDEMIRNYLKNRLSHAAISRVEIERTPKRITVMIFTARPGVVTSPISIGGVPGWNCQASPPSASFTSLGARSWNFLGSQLVQMWGGSRVCESASISRYSRTGAPFGRI